MVTYTLYSSSNNIFLSLDTFFNYFFSYSIISKLSIFLAA